MTSAFGALKVYEPGDVFAVTAVSVISHGSRRSTLYDTVPVPDSEIVFEFVNVSAYKGDNNMVIVAVNTGTASVSQKFIVQNGTVSQVSSWQTTPSSNMTAGQDFQVSGGSFSATLPGQSVTTFVGATSGVAIEPRPAFSPIETERQGYGFKAGIAKETIIVTPLGNNNAYDISVHMLNGRQVIINKDVKGISAIPVRTRGIYLININCNGHIQRKMVSFF
jgi:hypothetical protein